MIFDGFSSIFIDLKENSMVSARFQPVLRLFALRVGLLIVGGLHEDVLVPPKRLRTTSISSAPPEVLAFLRRSRSLL